MESSELAQFIRQLGKCRSLSERVELPRPKEMSRGLWARYVLGLMDESVLQQQPPWVWGVEGLDASLRPTYWDELEGMTGPDSRRIPDARLIRSPQDSEEVAAYWLQYLGFFDARPTPLGADGGIDVVGTGVVAQVKAAAKPTGRPVIQQTYGIAASRSAIAVVFSLAGYTVEALQWADHVGMALFRFDLQGEPKPANLNAERLMVEAEREVRRQESLEPLEIGQFGSERIRNALSLMVVEAMEVQLQSLQQAWNKERSSFPASEAALLESGLDDSLWVFSWYWLTRQASAVIGMAFLMEQLGLPFLLDPILPQLLFVLYEPHLRRMAALKERETREGGYREQLWNAQDVTRWARVRSRYQADQSEFTLAYIDEEVEALLRRNSSVLDGFERDPDLPDPAIGEGEPSEAWAPAPITMWEWAVIAAIVAILVIAFAIQS